MPETSRRLAPPSLFWLLVEGRAFYELGSSWLSRPILRKAPKGDGHPVMVLPGFVASDVSTIPLRRYLREMGYAAHPWKQGRNHGPIAGLIGKMGDRVRWLSDVYGARISLIGWSLGGVYARELAHLESDHVRGVITMGSPFTGDPRANHSWRLFEWLSGRKLEQIDPQQRDRIRQPPPVPSTAIYTRSDGITDWRCCIDPRGPRTESIEVPGSHCGLGFNPLVLYAIADRLAQPEGSWQPFERSGLRRWLYGEPETSS